MAYVRRSGRPQSLVTFDDATVAATMRILRAADRGLYDNVRATIKSEALNIKSQQQQAVRGLTSARGAARFLAATGGVARSAAAQKRAEKSAKRGLRERAARSLKIEYRERSTAKRPFLGVRVRMSATAMPPDQKRLPKHMNYGRWRHPVYGNNDNWVTQTIAPDGWFDGTFARMKGGAISAINRAITSAYRQAGLLK